MTDGQVWIQEKTNSFLDANVSCLIVLHDNNIVLRLNTTQRSASEWHYHRP